MAVQTDGFQGIIQGILQGHQIATQLRNQAMHEEAFQRQKESQDRESQLQDIQAQMQLSAAGRPVTGNMVEQSFDAPSPETVPGVGGGSQTVKFARPADKNRLLTYKTKDGRTIQTEAYTPQETYQRQIEQQMQAKRGGAIFDQQTGDMMHDYELATRGVPLPDDIAEANGYPKGSKVLPAELEKLSANASTVRKNNRVDVAPGASVVDLTPQRPSPFGGNAPMVNAKPDAGPVQVNLDGSTGEAAPLNPLAAAGKKLKDGQTAATDQARVLFSNAPKEEKQTPEQLYIDIAAGKLKNLDGTPKSAKQLTQEELGTILGKYKTDTADPEVRAASLQAKATSEASARLMEVLRQNQIDQAPTKEQAGLLADDLINHRLAPDQISQIRGRGNGALGLMIYSAAKKQDPNFSWEQASSEYTLAKSPAFQQTVRYMDSVSESIPLVIDRANKLANGGVKAITGLINAGKSQFNDIDLKKFQTDALLVADEIAKILSGGGTGSATSDAKLKQAGEILGKNDSPAAIAAALGDVQQLIGFRRKALTRGTYLENAHGNAGGAPSATTYKQTASGPNGHKIGTNDNGATWFDIETGQKVQ